MRRLVYFVLAILLVLLCSCGLFGPQRYYCDISNVDSVQIIKLGEFIDREVGYEYIVLSQVIDYEMLIDRLNRAEQSKQWNDPSVMYEGYTVIRIDYKNGDFDLIYSDVQITCRAGVIDYSNFVFNKDWFDTLISYYLRSTGDG